MGSAIGCARARSSFRIVVWVGLIASGGLSVPGCADDTFDPGQQDGGSSSGGDGTGNVGGPKKPSCPGQQSVVKGTVYAPNGSDPVPGATVFVPSQVPELFPPKVKCEVCGSLGTAYNFWTTTSGFDGKFTLKGVCPGKRHLVIQNGRFRRFLTVDVPKSGTLALTRVQSRLPKKSREFHPIDNVPKIAVATGDYDKMECVLRKMGLAESSFDLYEGAKVLKSPKKLVAWPTLVRDLDRMKGYNIIFINCTDNTFESELKNATVRDNIAAYVKAGGRLYVTDWSYDWIEQVASLAPFIDFEPGVSGSAPEGVDRASLGAGGLKIDAVIKQKAMAQWLGLFPGAISGGRARIEHFLTNWVMVNRLHKDAKLWVEGQVRSRDGTIVGIRPLTLTFNFKNCGKVLFSSYHTEGREGESPLFPKAFPTYCGQQSSPQDRILEYLIFDIANCVKPVQ